MTVQGERPAGKRTPLASSASVKRILPWLVAVAFFLESLDSTILSTAVPTIAAAVHVAPLSMKSVLTSYTLSLAVFIPISGWVADRYGTRRVFSSAIGIFTLGSFLCGISTNIHLLVLCRLLQGCGGAMMVPVGRLTLVRTFDKSELIRAMSFVAIPSLIGPMLGPLVGGLIVGLFHWRVIFFVNLPIGLAGLYLVYRHLPDYRAEHVDKLDLVGLLLFGVGIALLSYVLEIFGEHTLSGRAMGGLLGISVALLVGYWLHAINAPHPLLRLSMFRIRTLRASVVGSFITRLGAGGMPFLLPLLYQVGLGYTPVQSGLLIMPQSLAAISLRMAMPHILTRFGYRRVLLANTAIVGLVIALFSTIGPGTPIWIIVVQAVAFGFFSSLQYTSMNTLAYADVTERDTSMASTIVSTMQQMSMSFGVAAASLATTLFVPDRFHADAPQLIRGIHDAFLVLGGLTVLSALVFRELKSDDGDNMSQHHVLATEQWRAPPRGVVAVCADHAKNDRMHDLGLTHVALTSSDLDASIAFWSRYARMQVVHRRTGIVWLSDKTRPFVIVLAEAQTVDHPLLPFAHLGVGCASREEVDRLAALAKDEGRLVSGPRDSGPPVGYWAFIKDPDGHTLEISFGQEVGLTVEGAEGLDEGGVVLSPSPADS